MNDGATPPVSPPSLRDIFDAAAAGRQPLNDVLSRLSDEPADPAQEKQREHRLEALAAVGSATLAAIAVKAAGGTRNAAIILKDPMALATSLDPVQKLRVSEALEALARDPEGARLVKQLDDLKLPVVMSSSVHDTGGAFFSQRKADGAAGLVDAPQAVKVPGISTQGGLVALFAHELKHLEQARSGESNAFNGKIPPPEDVIRYDRVKEADAQATATEIAWRLKQQGDPAAWNSMEGVEGGWTGSPARAYESAVEADPAAASDGRAKRAAFDSWFTAKAGPATVAEVYLDQGLNAYPSQGERDILAARGAKQESLTEADYQRIGALSTPNYLTLPGTAPLTDPYYGQGSFTDWQKQQLARLSEENAGQGARLAPPLPEVAPAPHLSGDDALYAMNDKLSLRHVTTRAEVEAQYASPVTGDAFPLSGAGRLIASQAAAGDTAPLTDLPAGQDGAQQARFARLQLRAPGPERAAGIVAQNEDFVTGRYEQAIRDQVAHSFIFDGPSQTSHFMVLRGLQNADNGSYDSGYAYGKQGRDGILPEQVVSSLALGPEDMDALSSGRSAEDILTGKVIRTIQGLRTGDPALISDLRQAPATATTIRIPNGLAVTPPGLEPAAAEALHAWSVEALRQTITAPTAADRTRLNLLAEKAIIADPGRFLQQAKALLGTGNPHAAEIEANVPAWAERAFTALGEKNPALVAPVARYVADGLPEGDRLKAITDNVLAGRPAAPEPAKPVLGPDYTDVRPGASPSPEGVPLSRITGGAQGAVATLGLVQSGLGLYDAYKTGDRTEGVISGVNLAVSGTAGADAVMTAAGREAPLLAGAGKFVPGLNVATMVATGVYQVSKEDTVQHKEERAVAVGVTTGVGIVTSTATASAGEAAVLTGTLGAGGAAVTAVAAPVVLTTVAVVEVARTGDALIKDKRAWADTEHAADEYARPERLPDSAAAGGKPSILNYRHLPFELMEVSPGMQDANMSGPLARGPGGRIPVGEISKLDMTDPRNVAEFERALDAKIAQQGAIMKGNDSALPIWLRFGASGEKYEDAKLLQESLLGARAELEMYKKDLTTYAAGQAPAGPQSMFLTQNAPLAGITPPPDATAPVRKTPVTAPKVG